MAGRSGARSSLLHNFHQGCGGGSSGGWKFQTASARKSTCSKNCASLALVLQLQKCGEEFQAASVMAAPGRCLVPPSPPGPPQH